MKTTPVKLELLQPLPKRWDNYNYAECKISFSDGSVLQKVLLTEYPYKIMIARITIASKFGPLSAKLIETELDIIESSSYSEGVRAECMTNADDSM